MKLITNFVLKQSNKRGEKKKANNFAKSRHVNYLPYILAVNEKYILHEYVINIASLNWTEQECTEKIQLALFAF